MPCASYRWIMALPRNSENPFGFWTRDLPTDCRFAQDQTGVLAVFSLYYQRIDRGWPAVQSQPRAAQAAPGPGAALDRFGRSSILPWLPRNPPPKSRVAR